MARPRVQRGGLLRQLGEPDDGLQDRRVEQRPEIGVCRGNLRGDRLANAGDAERHQPARQRQPARRL